MDQKSLFQLIKPSLEFAINTPMEPCSRRIEDFDRALMQWAECTILPAGQFIVGVTPKLATDIAISMFDTPEALLTENEIRDALNELTNIMTGQVKNQLIPKAAIGIPSLIDSHIMNSLKNSSCDIQCMVQINDQYLFIGILGNVFAT